MPTSEQAPTLEEALRKVQWQVDNPTHRYSTIVMLRDLKVVLSALTGAERADGERLREAFQDGYIKAARRFVPIKELEAKADEWEARERERARLATEGETGGGG